MNFFKKVTKESFELKTSYLIRQVLTKWSNKYIVMFRRRIVVVVVEGLEERTKKNSFHTRK
jgi:hypothetical protein